MQTCRECGRQLPLSSFRLSRTGNPVSVCRECMAAKHSATCAAKRATMRGGKPLPFSDPDFDGKDPGEVIRMMGRAKRWLESRGFIIKLDGEFHETKIRKLKFE